MRPVHLLLGMCVVLSPALTSAQGTDRPTVVIVQAGLGPQTAEAVRAELAQRFSLRVVTLREVTTNVAQPDALLTLALDTHGTLSAMYWTRTGALEVLSAPAPEKPDALQVAATTLAAAVLQKHLAYLRATERSDRDLPDAQRSADDTATEEQLDRAAVYAALTRLGQPRHRTLGLKLEDF
jgi:hypothetical protein